MTFIRYSFAAATALDIIVHDHIIVDKNSHFSSREKGWLRGKV